MTCFSDAVKKLFKEGGQEKLCGELEALHAQLVERRVAHIEYGDPANLNAKENARLNCQLLRHALLHRAERLMVGTGTAILDKNPYALALIVRGHVEVTAVMGYFCYRLRSLAQGNITLDAFSADLANTVAGGKHDLFAERGAPKSIASTIQSADKFLNDEVFEEQKKRLEEGYAWLSEFAHPNFLSHSNAFTLDKAAHWMVFRRDDELQKDDFQHAVFLSISAELFIALFDMLTALDQSNLTVIAITPSVRERLPRGH
jgi:hypothetical protein